MSASGHSGRDIADGENGGPAGDSADGPADGSAKRRIDGARPEESGYRRDDYWRQQQQDLPPDAGAGSRDDADAGTDDRADGSDERRA